MTMYLIREILKRDMIYPTWRIIEMNAMSWPMFMSYNFIKFIEPSIYRADELSFKLKENETLLVNCFVE